MAVELAVLVPVVVVVALTVVNLARFVELCAQFDRVAPDAVIAHGVAPAGGGGRITSVSAVEAALADAMRTADAASAVDVRVSARAISEAPHAERTLAFPLSPLLTEFTCTMAYHPWPSTLVLAGVAYDSPLALSHERTIVVDCYRSGVVV